MPTHKNSATPQELLSDLQALVKETEAMVADKVSDYSEEALASLRTRYAVAQERFTDACASARKKVVAGAHYTDETIRANPYQSLAIATGLGVLIGILVSRRNN
ncbi:DUF883 family protein [Horticoccus sp. 23ND18S-11]|uniref:DUF883 family protein n=1 Tax=Horticoccus sp. 23ND18S-11 TaxID=3391832 RepID=UPI0039C8F78F